MRVGKRCDLVKLNVGSTLRGWLSTLKNIYILLGLLTTYSIYNTNTTYDSIVILFTILTLLTLEY